MLVIRRELPAEVIGRALMRQAFGQEPPGAGPRLLPTRRLPVPPPEPVLPVPPAYRATHGRHEPHPGTGRGYGRQRASRAG